MWPCEVNDTPKYECSCMCGECEARTQAMAGLELRRRFPCWSHDLYYKILDSGTTSISPYFLPPSVLDAGPSLNHCPVQASTTGLGIPVITRNNVEATWANSRSSRWIPWNKVPFPDSGDCGECSRCRKFFTRLPLLLPPAAGDK